MLTKQPEDDRSFTANVLVLQEGNQAIITFLPERFVEAPQQGVGALRNFAWTLVGCHVSAWHQREVSWAGNLRDQFVSAGV